MFVLLEHEVKKWRKHSPFPRANVVTGRGAGDVGVLSRKVMPDHLRDSTVASRAGGADEHTGS